jgi:hypothetical protein
LAVIRSSFIYWLGIKRVNCLGYQTGNERSLDLKRNYIGLIVYVGQLNILFFMKHENFDEVFQSAAVPSLPYERKCWTVTKQQFK